MLAAGAVARLDRAGHLAENPAEPSRRGDTVQGATSSYAVERLDGGSFEPDVIDGTQIGEFRPIEPGGPTASRLDVGLWRSDPGTCDYFFEGDEAFHVVEGSATVELPGTGETVELRAGDVAHFRAGTRSVWTFPEPFKKFVVISS